MPGYRYVTLSFLSDSSVKENPEQCFLMLATWVVCYGFGWEFRINFAPFGTSV